MASVQGSSGEVQQGSSGEVQQGNSGEVQQQRVRPTGVCCSKSIHEFDIL